MQQVATTTTSRFTSREDFITELERAIEHAATLRQDGERDGDIDVVIAAFGIRVDEAFEAPELDGDGELTRPMLDLSGIQGHVELAVADLEQTHGLPVRVTIDGDHYTLEEAPTCPLPQALDKVAIVMDIDALEDRVDESDVEFYGGDSDGEQRAYAIALVNRLTINRPETITVMLRDGRLVDVDVDGLTADAPYACSN